MRQARGAGWGPGWQRSQRGVAHHGPWCRLHCGHLEPAAQVTKAPLGRGTWDVPPRPAVNGAEQDAVSERLVGLLPAPNQGHRVVGHGTVHLQMPPSTPGCSPRPCPRAASWLDGSVSGRPRATAPARPPGRHPRCPRSPRLCSLEFKPGSSLLEKRPDQENEPDATFLPERFVQHWKIGAAAHRLN